MQSTLKGEKELAAKITYASLKLSKEDHSEYESELQKIHERLFPVSSHNPAYVVDRDPSNPSQTLAVWPAALPDAVERAIEQARAVAPKIKKLAWDGRRKILQNARELVWKRRHRVAVLLTAEVGKNRSEALAEVLEVIAMIDFYEKICKHERNFTRVLHNAKTPPWEYTQVSLEPVGPFAIISPFNFPFALAANMSMSTFIAGNPVLFKPASDTILSTLAWRNILVDAGVPAEACAFLVGGGSTVGNQLVNDTRIAGVAFTGSVDVGLGIERICSQIRHQHIARTFVAEMGGKNALVVTANADIEKAADGIIRSVVGFGGQKCSALSRIYVEKAVAADLVDALTDPKRLAPIVVGDPGKRETFFGPVINETAFHRYHNLRATLTARRATMIPLCANPGEAESLAMTTEGYFVEPILATNIAHGDDIEYFLPYAALHVVESLDQAIKEANETAFGLCAGIMSEDENEVNEFFERIEAGVVYANRRGGATTGAWPGIQSFGGWKMSGLSGSSAFGPWYPTRFAREQCRTIAYDSKPT